MKKLIYLNILGILIVACSKSDDEPVINQEYECIAPTSLLTSLVTHNLAKLHWDENGHSIGFVLEYGEVGFTGGNGFIIEDVRSPHTIENLDASTDYEFFVTSVCVDGTSFEASVRKGFRTEDCPIVNIYDAISITEVSATVRWHDNSFVNNYDVEYGEEGFVLGTGTTRTVTERKIDLVDLNGGTKYDVYVRTKCGNVFGDYSEKFTFETQPLCFTPTNIYWVTRTSNSVRIAWNGQGESSWQIQYGHSGFPLGTGTFLNTSSNPYTIQGLNSNTTYEIYIRANCGSDGYSEWSQSYVVTTL